MLSLYTMLFALTIIVYDHNSCNSCLPWTRQFNFAGMSSQAGVDKFKNTSFFKFAKKILPAVPADTIFKRQILLKEKSGH